MLQYFTDIAESIDEIAEQVELLRVSAGSYVNGIWTQPAPSSSFISASVQPAKSHELMRLSEGRREKGAVVIHSREPLRISEGLAQPDRIIHGGRTYEVDVVDDRIFHGAFYRAIATEVNNG